MDVFSEAEIRTFVESRLRGTGVEFGAAEIHRIREESGGVPRKVQEAAEILYNSRSHGLRLGKNCRTVCSKDFSPLIFKH